MFIKFIFDCFRYVQILHSHCAKGVAGLHCGRADDAQPASFAQTVEHAVVGYLFLKTARKTSVCLRYVWRTRK